MECIKSKPSNNINNVRNKENLNPLLLLLKEEIKYYNTYKSPIRN